MKKIVILALIIILGTVLRFYRLTDFPDGIHIDESSRSYNAYSILKTGKDEYGKKFPLFFESEGEYKLPVHNYISALYFGIFPMNKFTDRALPAFFSVCQILVFYFLLLEITRSGKQSMLGAFLLSISHWTINFARNSDTNQLTNLLILLAVLFFIKFIKKQSLVSLILIFIFSLLAVFTYRTAVIFLPIFLIIVFIYFFRKNSKKALFLIFYSFMLALIIFSSSVIVKRLNSEGVSSYPEIESILGEQIREDGNKSSTVITRLFHNKIFNSGKLFAEKYFANLDPTFLFFKGDMSLNNSIVNEPNLLYFEIFPFIFGIYVFIKRKEKKSFGIIPILFILVTPIATSVTRDNPNASRMLPAFFGFAFFISLGIVVLTKVRFGKILALFTVLLYGYFMSYMLHEYYIHKPIHQAWFRDPGTEELVSDLEKMKSRYKKIYFDKNFVTEYLFIDKYDPQKLQERIRQNPGYNSATKTMSIIDDKYVSRGGACHFTDGEENALYVCTSSAIAVKSRIVKIYRYKDGQVNYILIEYDKNAMPDRSLPINVTFL